MSQDEKGNLKLIVRNREDLKVISAYSQDSIVAVKDITFLKKNRIFVMIMNRFMWEDIEKGVFRKNKRIRCAVKFETVLRVKTKNINQNNKNKPLECLALKCMPTSNEGHEIKIFFAGNGIITIISETIEVAMEDIGKHWNVKSVPIHKI